MKTISWSRRDMLKATGASLLALSEGSRETLAQIAAQPGPQSAVSLPGDDDRGQRMKWRKAARFFGMFPCTSKCLLHHRAS